MGLSYDERANMKLKLILVIFLSGLTAAAWSQVVIIKPAIGMNKTWLPKDDAGKKYGPGTGFDAGASALMGGKFYVEPGLFYVRKIVHYTTFLFYPLFETANSSQLFQTGPTSKKTTYHLSGIQIPLAVGYHIIGGQSATNLIGLSVFTGASAFVLRTTDQTTYLKKTQWSMFAGAGVDVACLFLDAKYEWSLSDLEKENEGLHLGRSKSVYLNLGVRIPVVKAKKQV